MKLAILGTRGIPASYGGFETFADQLSTRLVERGIDVTVFCDGSLRGPQPATYKGVELQYIKTWGGPISTILYDVRCLLKARSGFDVVYMLGYGASFACSIPRLWGSRVWINIDGLEWKRAKWNWLARTYLHSMEGIAMLTPNRVIADARAIRDSVSQRYPWNPVCDVIPYGSESVQEPPPAALRECNIDPGKYALVVCRFEPENNVNEVIQGYIASRSSLPLVLVGDAGTQSPYVKHLLQYRSDSIRFIGTVFDQAKLSALRYYSAIYFHGHSVGGTNPSLLEAMGCSNLVVAHDNVFNREVLGDAGLFFSTPEQLASVIRDIEHSSEQTRELKAAARERAKRFYTWDRITTAYVELMGASDQVVDYAPPVSEAEPLSARGLSR